jgi:hypothetical protein
MFQVRSINNVWIGYRTWFIWRWAQRFPEDIAFIDNPDVQAHMAPDDSWREAA